MRIISTADSRALRQLARQDASREASIQRRVRRIVDDVRRRGDSALRQWARRLDGVDPPYEVSRRQMRAAWDQTPRDLRRGIRTAIDHVRRVAARQVPRPFTVEVRPGVRIEGRVAPLDRVACYVPGGRFPLPSTAIMTVVPARVAGVRDVVVLCPHATPPVLAAALAAGASAVYRLGGAQAIAAAAYGTSSIPRVDKIVGPGNAWVTAAKMIVAADCAIDFRAGPSEIVVWSEAGQPAWIAADLAAQAEHDPHARAVLVTTRPTLAKAVADILAASGPQPANIALVIARNRGDAIAFINRFAPEHLVCDRARDAEACRAGTIFVGRWSAQAAGDYCTGSNHVLPTGGDARLRGGLSAADFVRTYTTQSLTAAGLRSIASATIALAEAEGLRAHAESIRVRMEESQA
jgi:histidinol dehydrogenase